MRILFVTQWFDPEPFFKGINYVKRLMEKGHDVQVLTGFPNYPNGKVYEGYKIRLLQHENMDGVSVMRTVLYPSHDNSAIKRIINYFSFAFSSSLLGILKINKADIVYVYHPPVTVGITALIFKKFWKVPYIYEIQDIWPDTLKATGMVNNQFILKIIEKLCNIVYKNADRIIVISPGFKKKLVSKGINDSKIDVIYNPCDETNIYPRKKDEALAMELGLFGKFNVLFTGNMGKAQALESVLRSAEIIMNKFSKIQFVFIGGGIEENYLKNCAKDMKLTNALFLKRVPLSEIGKIIALADVVLVHLKDDPLFEITIPGKTQSYMASGKPIIMGVKGDASDLVTRANAGIICKPENPKSISDAIETAYNMIEEELINLGKNGRRFYESELSLEVMLNQLNNIFHEAVHNY